MLCESINLIYMEERSWHPESGKLDANFYIFINSPSDIASGRLSSLICRIETTVSIYSVLTECQAF